MIWLYTGTPGSGKTLHAVERILSNLKYGVTVLSNIELALPEDSYVFFQPQEGSETPAFLEQFGLEHMKAYSSYQELQGSILLVLDECQLYLNSRRWQKNELWLRFFSQHRKYGYNVILIAQSDRMVDRQVRSLIEICTEHLIPSMSVVRPGLSAPIFKVVESLHGKFRYVSYWYGHRNMIIERGAIRDSKKAFAVYDTCAVHR